MPNVDAFLQFVAEEVNREERVFLRILPPGTTGEWTLFVGEPITRGDQIFWAETLGEALNKASMALDFTHKPLYLSGKTSLAEEVTREFGGTGLTIEAGHDSPTWRVGSFEMDVWREDITLESGLRDLLADVRGMRG